jgi:DNA polymerase III gamma/tau subunit
VTLYQKYRPTSLAQIIGNTNAIAAIEAILLKEDPPHAYLFTGDTGCGKTTIARIMLRALGCIGNDMKEIDSADFRGIDTIRDIRRQSAFKPLEGDNRGWLLDEVHMMTPEAQNALLKALEDTPPHVYFFLCTTNPQKLLDTIKGRCVQFQVNTLNDLQMKKLLRDVVHAEKESLDKPVYDQIILDSLGHPRNALQILEKVLGVDPKHRLDIAKQTAERQSQTIELCRAMLNGSPWRKIAHILSGLKEEDPEQIRRAVLGYCSSILLTEENERAAMILYELREPTYDTGFPGLLSACHFASRQE